jgi:hypothetical protein
MLLHILIMLTIFSYFYILDALPFDALILKGEPSQGCLVSLC